MTRPSSARSVARTSVGRIRQIEVAIGGSVYLPLAIPQRLEELFDLLLAKAKKGGTDMTADFNCDAFVTDADMDFMVPHGGDDCPPPDPTPTIHSSWGSLKVIYR